MLLEMEQPFLRRAGKPADGFENHCDRQRLAGRHRRGRLLPRHLSRAQLHNFDGRQPAHGQVRGFGDIWPAAQLQGQAGLFQQQRRPQPEGAAHWRRCVSLSADSAAADGGAAADSGAAVYTGGSARPTTAALHQQSARRRPGDRQLLQQRRHAAAHIRVALWVVRQQSHHCPDQLSGAAATGAQKVAFQLTDQFLNVMLDPFVDGSSGVGGADHPALGFAPERETMPPDIAHAYASVLKAPQAPVPVYEPRWTAWGGAYGGSNRTSGDLAVSGSHDLSARAVGFAAGLDYRLTPNSVVGLALAGGGTNWNLSQGLGGGKSDAFQAGVYGATRSGPAYLAAAFAFTNHWMSTDRFAVGDHLTANFNAQSYGGRLESGYRFATIYGGITPYAAIQAQSFHTPGYTETDAIANGFALTFNGRDATDTRSELGARFDRVLAVYTNAVLALRARVAWAHDWVSDPTLLPMFQALPGASFIVDGATLAKNSALTSAGAELRLANGVTLLAKFDGEFASHSSTYAGTGTVRYVW